MNETTANNLQKTSNIQKFSIKQLFLISLIVSLSISALIAIFVFLLGDFGETEIRLLLTTLTVGGYSLTGLCSSVLYDKRSYLLFAFLGMVISFLGFLTTVGVIWEILDFNNIWKLVIVLLILAFSIAHSSLLLLARSDKNIVNIPLTLTLIFITTVTLMLIYLFIFEYDVNNLYYRLLGVFAVLNVLGTIVTPILKKFNS